MQLCVCILYVDMQAEQNILTDRVFGEIRRYSRHKYGIDFHVRESSL